MTTELQRLSVRVAKMLADKRGHVVFAESCTGGLVAASLSQVPGISQHLCGSMVVYQNATKNTWLGIEEQTLQRPGPVSQVVARRLAERVLENTPHANLAASVTGHFGPQAPANLDGIVYVALSERGRANEFRTTVRRHRLRSTSRRARQREAAVLVLTTVLQSLESMRR